MVDLNESSNTGGPDKKHKDESNYVSIAHADGTIGEYHHLKADGVLVEIGDRVTAGQAIALSGDTGYSTLPAPALRGLLRRRRRAPAIPPDHVHHGAGYRSRAASREGLHRPIGSP